MRTITRAGAAALGCTALLVSSLFAGDQSEYMALLEAEEKKVAATRTTRDDVAFAKKLLKLAEALDDSADTRKLFCQKAVDFGMKHRDGYETAGKAIGLLKKFFPDQAGQWAQKNLELAERQYKTSRGTARKAAAEAYLDALVDRARSLAAEGKGDKARALYEKATPVAKVAGTEWTKRIRERRRELVVQIAQRRKRELKLKSLQAKLAANPKDAKAREVLIRFHLCNTGDLAAATKLLTPDVDESLHTYILLAGKLAEDLSESACLELGQWCRSIAKTATGKAKASMLVRAKTCYRRYLSLHTKQDASVIKAKVALKQIDADLARKPVKRQPKKPPPKAAPTSLYTNSSGRTDVKEAEALARRIMASDRRLFSGKKRGLDLAGCYDAAKMPSRDGHVETVAGSHAEKVRAGRSHSALVYGPHVNFGPGRFIAVYRLRAMQRTTDKVLCRMNISENDESLFSRRLGARSFASGRWKEAIMTFKLTVRRKLEIQIWGRGNDIAVDRLYVFKVVERKKGSRAAR